MFPVSSTGFLAPGALPSGPSSSLPQALGVLGSQAAAQSSTLPHASLNCGSAVTAGVGAAAVAATVLAARQSRRQANKASRSGPSRVIGVSRQAAEEGSDGGSMDFLTTPFPFSAVVGQRNMKLALILNLIDPSIGGCLISGDRGTGKSTAVRAMVRLLPDIDVVGGDRYNSDPKDESTMSEDCLERLDAGEELPVAQKKTPFVELPLGATEDRVTGTIDIEKALLEAGKAYEPGILARVNRGVLYIDEVNLLDDMLVDVLLDSAAGGWNTVEREGVSVRHPARFLLIGTAHPDEGDLRPQLLDRFGMTVLVQTPTDGDTRFQVLSRASAWSNKPSQVEDAFAKEDEKLKQKITEARERLKDVKIARELKVKVSTLCSRLNVDGMRGDIVTNRACRAYAAYKGRTEVTEQDVRRVAVMCLQHRLRKDVVSDNLLNTIAVMEVLNELIPKPEKTKNKKKAAAQPEAVPA
eukprot:TRINITY_DN25300_c0_g1_i1.p1 TRINITY_DN25300_c0_g1~~TRINITY_DN25300_c0_g1_i1.p1  ORF type:complete len:468 (-),score=113.23 TRINITY_DN25300_c0_g1_i1:250-1653(-)